MLPVVPGERILVFRICQLVDLRRELCRRGALAVCHRLNLRCRRVADHHLHDGGLALAAVNRLGDAVVDLLVLTHPYGRVYRRSRCLAQRRAAAGASVALVPVDRRVLVGALVDVLVLLYQVVREAGAARVSLQVRHLAGRQLRYEGNLHLEVHRLALAELVGCRDRVGLVYRILVCGRLRHVRVRRRCGGSLLLVVLRPYEGVGIEVVRVVVLLLCHHRCGRLARAVRQRVVRHARLVHADHLHREGAVGADVGRVVLVALCHLVGRRARSGDVRLGVLVDARRLPYQLVVHVRLRLVDLDVLALRKGDNLVAVQTVHRILDDWGWRAEHRYHHDRWVALTALAVLLYLPLLVDPVVEELVVRVAQVWRRVLAGLRIARARCRLGARLVRARRALRIRPEDGEARLDVRILYLREVRSSVRLQVFWGGALQVGRRRIELDVYARLLAVAVALCRGHRRVGARRQCDVVNLQLHGLRAR